MTFFVVLLAFCALVVGATELGRESLRQKLSNAPHLCVSCSVAPLWVHSKSDAHHFAWHEAFPLAHAVVILPAASKSFEGNSCLDGWTEGLHLPNSRCAYMICAQHLYLRTSFLRASLEESQIRKLYLLQTNTHKKERKRKKKKNFMRISEAVIWKAGFSLSAGFESHRGCFGTQALVRSGFPQFPVSGCYTKDQDVDSAK